jgi:hypothetical protein
MALLDQAGIKGLSSWKYLSGEECAIIAITVGKEVTELAESRAGRDSVARVCQLEAIIENLYPYIDHVGVLTDTEKEQRKRMVEQLEALMPWLIPRQR